MTDEIKCFVCDWYSCEDVESGMCVHCAKKGYSSDVCNFMKRLHSFAYPFEVWKKTRGKNIRNSGAPAQPSLAWAADGEKYGLYIGDADDWCTSRTMDELDVKTIFNLCPDQTHWNISALQSAMKMFVKKGVVFINFPANDVHDFDIVQEVCNKGCLAMIQTRLEFGNVLVNCWGGVNRSGAVVVAYLNLIIGIPLATAFEHVSNARGCILTNYGFRLKLAQAAERSGQPLLPTLDG